MRSIIKRRHLGMVSGLCATLVWMGCVDLANLPLSSAIVIESVEAGQSVSAQPGDMVILTASLIAAGEPVDADTVNAAYTWTQLDGDLVTLSHADAATVSFTAPESTTTPLALRFEVTATVGGATYHDTVDVRIADTPVADAGDATSVIAGSQVILDGSASYDPDGAELTYTWVQTAGPEVDLMVPASSSLAFVAPTVAEQTTLTFRLTVSNGVFSAMDEVTVTVEAKLDPAAAELQMEILASTVAGTAPLTVELTAVRLDGLGLAEGAYVWDFGDGAMAEGMAVTHTYTAGTYMVTLCATIGPEPAPTTGCVSALRASDTGLTATTITVTPASTGGGGSPPPPANTAPQAQASSISTPQGIAVLVTLQANDLDGDSLTYSIVTAPTHGSLASDDGDAMVTYTPEPGFTGADSFTFKASDGQADSNIATVAITVIDTNVPPVASDAAVNTDEDMPVNITLSASDPDGDVLTYVIITAPAHGSLTSDDGDNVIGYTPEPNTHGPDTFTFRARDALTASNTAMVTITVNPVNDAPTAANGAAETDADAAVEITLDASDVDGDTLTYAIITAPTHGSLTSDDGDATVTYTPNLGYVGPDALTYTVNDGQQASAPATVSIAVNPIVVPPDQRTANRPDSWLVLYNVNSPDSIAWKDWYIAQWGIPTANTLGLDVDPNQERIQRDVFRSQIWLPVQAYIANTPDMAAKVMGILVGYRVPGNYYQDASNPVNQGGGGWSVTNKLQNIDENSYWLTRMPFNPHYFRADLAPGGARLTKATLAAYTYITARIDAPSLDQAKLLTTRAKAIVSRTTPLAGEAIYYDYQDVGAPGGDMWTALYNAVNSESLNTIPGQFPWQAFESDGPTEEPTPNCALRFSYYRLTDWQLADWGGAPQGSRILGYAFNSFGATTVRSTTDLGGRYVPNALFNGGFAAAVGATAEPYVANSPHPATMLWCLADGRTLGEAVFHATATSGWMWELLGDPLLTVPEWFMP